ncbi:MAG TPA: hypothetical protein VF979_07960 [Streptosporangiaceae bacterium]
MLQGASGVLEVAGNPSGAIYLDGGEITFAQASWVPDLADRITEVGGSADRVRALLLDGAGNGLDAGALLMQDGNLSRAALKAVLRSVVIDALIVLTMPLGDETSVTATSFQPAATHWARGYCRLKASSMRAVAAKRSSGLARCGLAVSTRLELRDLAQPCAVLSKEHWAVASRIDGNLSIRDLARECGIPLYDAIDRVCYLSRKGLCAARSLEAESAAGGPSAAGSPSTNAVSTSPAVTATIGASTAAFDATVTSETTVARKKPRYEPMARRVSAAAAAPANVLADALRSAAPSQPPTTDQLRRVLEGLRRLT